MGWDEMIAGPSLRLMIPMVLLLVSGKRVNIVPGRTIIKRSDGTGTSRWLWRSKPFLKMMWAETSAMTTKLILKVESDSFGNSDLTKAGFLLLTYAYIWSHEEKWVACLDKPTSLSRISLRARARFCWASSPSRFLYPFRITARETRERPQTSTKIVKPIDQRVRSR